MTGRVLGTLTVAAVAVALPLAANAAASDGHDNRTHHDTLRFAVEFSPFNLIDVGAPDFSDGDEIVFHDTLFKRDRQAGDQLGSCVVVDQTEFLANCTMVVRLSRGHITAQFANSPPPVKQLAVTGGTGAYGDVAGTGTLVENGDGTGTLTLTLTR
jgi:hypothetical protein